MIKKELEKKLAVGIIRPVRHTTWVSNPVIVRKKSGDIRICIDFRNLDQASLKYNYPLPNMENLLQSVTGARMLSMLDSFSGYNQVQIRKEDRGKITFTTPSETYEYIRMPFGLLNVGSTFQRAMDQAFSDLIGKIIAIYQDDLTVFSKERGDHVKHLRKILDRCRKFVISLNPKKSTFGIDEVKLLGHIFSKDGIRIDPERVQAINAIPPPHDIPSLQSFFGKINFVRRVILNLPELAKPLNALLKKNVKFVWDKKCDISFSKLKKAISTSPVLSWSDYNKDFMIYSYASEDTIATVLLQKNNENHKQPIAFMSKNLRDA